MQISCSQLSDNLKSIQSFHFMIPPLIRNAPKTPLPDPDQDLEWYGEFDMRYPLAPNLCPMKYGHVFKARGALSVIVNDFSCHRFPDDHSSASNCSSQTLADFAAQLLHWYQSLGLRLELQRKIIQQHDLETSLHL